MAFELLDRFNHFEKLMKNVVNAKELCDANLIAGKHGKKFSVHRVIMRAASEYFDALLGPNFLEGNKRDIVLKDIDGETLQSIIDYIYHGQITINYQNMCAIAAASSWMQLSKLEKKCAEFGKIGLDETNCIEVFIKANEHQLVEFRSIAFDMICANYDKLTNDELAKIDRMTFQELLVCDQLSGAESDIFNGLVRWLAINETCKRISIRNLLKLIRLPHIPTQILVDTVEPFFVKHKLRNLISDEYRNRLLRPNDTSGLGRRRPKDIYFVSALRNKIKCMKYDQNENDWIHIKTIDLKSICHNIMGNANGQLYVEWSQYKMCAYDLRGFTRIELPQRITSCKYSTLVAVGSYLYVFGIVQAGARPGDSRNCERYDIEKKTWTARKNMPMCSWSRTMTAIEYNGLIYVGLIYENLTQLYRYNPTNDTWHLMLNVASRAIFAKISSSLYVIEDDRVLRRYDPTNGVLSSIGDFTFTGRIERIIAFRDEIYLLGKDQFVKLMIQENVIAVKLKPMTDNSWIGCEHHLYVN